MNEKINISICDPKTVSKEQEQARSRITQQGENIRYGYPELEHVISLGNNAGVISRNLETSKYSDQFYCCLGLVLTGIRQKNHQRISLLAHINPEYFADNDKSSEILAESVTAFVDEVKNSSIQAIGFGGDIEDLHLPDTLDKIGGMTEILASRPLLVINTPSIRTDERKDFYLETSQNCGYIFREDNTKKIEIPYKSLSQSLRENK